MEPNQSVARWITSAAAVGIWAPGMLILLGWIGTQAKHRRLGLSDPAAMPSVVEMALQGWFLLYRPIILVAVLYAALWVALRLQKKTTASVKSVPFLSMLAASAILAMFIALTNIGDGTPVLVPGPQITVFDAIAIVVAAVAVSLLLSLALSSDVRAKNLAGDTVPGFVIMAFLIVASLSGMALFEGEAEGNDIRWGCVGASGVQLESRSPAIDSNTTYVLITHAGGFYFLRDPNLDGNTMEAIAVPENLVEYAVYRHIPTQNEC